MMRPDRKYMSLLSLLLGCLLGLAGPAWSEEGDLDKGISAYRAGQYETASAYLESAVRKDPLSSTAYYYLGLTAFGMEQYEQAVASLKKSLSLDPGKSDAPLYIGMAYYHMNLYDFSIKALGQAIAQEPSGGAAYFFRGLSYAKLGQYERARADLRRSGELDHEFKQRAEYQTAMTYMDEGRTGPAETALRTAARRDPDSVVGREAKRHLRESEEPARVVPERPWTLDLGAGVLYDDNVSSSDQDLFTDEADTAVTVEVSGSYRFPRWKGVDFDAGYDFYQSLYSDLTDFNLRSHVLSVDAFRAGEPLDAGIGYSYSTSSLGDESLLNAHTFTASLGQAVSGFWYPNLLVKLQAREFPHDEIRDGSQLGMGLDNYLFPEGVKGHVLLGYRYTSEDVDAEYLDYWGNTLRAGIRHGFDLDMYAVKAGAEYEYLTRYYRDHLPSGDVKREDVRNVIRLNLEVSLQRNLAALAEYEHIDSESNLKAADYSENLISFRVRLSL